MSRRNKSIICPDHMTKMVAMPIYGKRPFKNLMNLKLGTQQKGLEPYKINDVIEMMTLG